MIFSYFGDPGAAKWDSRRPLWSIFMILRMCFDFGDALGTKKESPFACKMQAGTHFLQSCGFGGFWSALVSYFFVLWGAPRLILGAISTPFSEPWASEKTAESM